MITLPADRDILPPLVRILEMSQGGWFPIGSNTNQQWSELPAPPRLDRNGRRYYGRQHGYELDSVEQACLPEIGAAVFHFDYGQINGILYTVQEGVGPTTARDLIGHDVRIQMAPAPSGIAPATPFVPAWKTVFLGTVISQEDEPWANNEFGTSSHNAGRRTYRCADLMYRTQRWPMNRHIAVAKDANLADSNTNPRAYIHSYGHPGYNYAVQGYYRRTLGNKWAGGWPLANGVTPSAYIDIFGDGLTDGALRAGTNLDKYLPHTWTGAGSTYATTWTDLEVVNHALASSRSLGEPCLVVRPGDVSLTATSALSGAIFPWPVSEGESCWDFINRVLARQRSRGLARLWWGPNADGTSLGTESTDQPGNIYPCIAIFPQSYDDITYTYTPSGGSPTTVTFYGAHTAGTYAAVDLQNDHRVPKDSIELAKNATATIDYLESFGEPIEMLATLSPGDGATSHVTDGSGTLVKRWTAADETAFAAIPSANTWQRSLDRWRPIWQRWSLPPVWDFKLGDGNGNTRANANWYCNDAGTLTLFNEGSTTWLYDTGYRGNASPLMCRILSDLPLYEGYDYTTNATTRYDAATDTISPPRLGPFILERTSGGTYADAVHGIGATLQNDDFGVFVTAANDYCNGTRYFSADGVPGCSPGGFSNLTLTVGLQLSHRVRCATASASYTPTNAPRRKALYFPGVFLWIADYQAIWRIGHITNNEASPYMDPARAACGATADAPGILRDDRQILLALHALAWAWYSVSHRTARWSMRDCGLLPSFTNNVTTDGATTATATAYPYPGQFVPTIAGSDTFTVNTPITRIVYDARAMVTTWMTDWGDLDLA